MKLQSLHILSIIVARMAGTISSAALSDSKNVIAKTAATSFLSFLNKSVTPFHG